MDAVGAITINISVSFVTGTGEALEGVLASGILVAVVLTGDTLVDLGLAASVIGSVVTVLAVTDSFSALLVLSTLDSVAFVFVLAVENSGTGVASDWSVVVVLANALVALALLDATSILATWVRIALFLIATDVSTAEVSFIALAFIAVTLVGTCGVLMTFVATVFTLVLVTDWLAGSIDQSVTVDALALVSVALVSTGSVLAAVSVVGGALVLVAAVVAGVAWGALAGVPDALVDANTVSSTLVVTIALIGVTTFVAVASEALFADTLVAVALVDTVGVYVTTS